MKFKLVENIDNRLNEKILEEGLHVYLDDVANLMATNGYTNIVIDYHTNKIIGDKSNKTYLFEIIFNNINPKLNDRFYVNYLPSVNNNAKVYPVATTHPIGPSIGKAGIGFPRAENRRQYIPGVFIWELNRLAPIDPTTWP